MSRPLTLRPAMSRAGMSSLTLTQLHAINNVRVGDLILVERATSLVAPFLVLVDAISSTARDSFHITTRAQYEVNPGTLFDLQRYGTWNIQYASWNWERNYLLEDLLTPTDRLTLSPTIQSLRTQFMGGICLYKNCVHGLVHKSPVTTNDVHFRETESRAGRQVFTLCPWCMGHDLQQKHECLVTSTDQERYGEGVQQAHLQHINARRAEMRYDPLPHDVDLLLLNGQQTQAMNPVNLDNYQSQAIGGASRPSSPTSEHTAGRRRSRTPRTFRVPQPVQSRHSSRRALHWDKPRVTTHTFKWYQTAWERVLNDVCGLCQEDYKEGDRIADLSCQHFYHDKCLDKCFDFQRERRVDWACPLCRREV